MATRGAWNLDGVWHHGIVETHISSRTHCGHTIPSGDEPQAWPEQQFGTEECQTCVFEEAILVAEETRLRERNPAQPALESVLQFQDHGEEDCEDCGAPTVAVGYDRPYGEGVEWALECCVEAGVDGDDEAIQGYVYDETTQRWNKAPDYAAQLLRHLKALHEHQSRQLDDAMGELCLQDLADTASMAA
jgi:hypothetical protein